MTAPATTDTLVTLTRYAACRGLKRTTVEQRVRHLREAGYGVRPVERNRGGQHPARYRLADLDAAGIGEPVAEEPKLQAAERLRRAKKRTGERPDEDWPADESSLPPLTGMDAQLAVLERRWLAERDRTRAARLAECPPPAHAPIRRLGELA